jgi:hypothetical protein
LAGQGNFLNEIRQIDFGIVKWDLPIFRRCIPHQDQETDSFSENNIPYAETHHFNVCDAPPELVTFVS